MGKRIKLPRISRPTQPISQLQPEQQQTMLTGMDKGQLSGLPNLQESRRDSMRNPPRPAPPGMRWVTGPMHGRRGVGSWKLVPAGPEVGEPGGPTPKPGVSMQTDPVTGRDKFQQAMDKRRRELERKQMMGFQNELDEADTKEMLGDKFGEYEKAMSALGSPVEQREYSKQGELERQQAKRREVRQQFGLQGEGADDPLAKFRTDRRNKQIDEKIAKYGSFDKYETETRTENRKKQIQDLINKGDIDAAVAAENQFKDEDTKRDTKRTQIEEFRKRYGLEAPAPVDERERFGTYLDQKRQPKQNFGDLRNLIGGGNMKQPMPEGFRLPAREGFLFKGGQQRPMPRPMPALPEQPPMQPPMGGSVKQRPGKRPIGIRRPQPGINVDGGTSSRTRINAPNLRGFRF